MKSDKVLRDFITNSLENTNTAAGRYYCEDPTTVGFNLFFEFDQTSPLLNETSVGESAERYLRSINEPERADSIVSFRNRLKDLTRRFPYYLQSLGGLENIYTFEPKAGYDERIIEITTLETLDMKIAGLIGDYMKATWDFEYRRSMLPDNMREFTFSILVSEIRSLRTFVKKTIGENTSIDLKEINSMLSTFEFYFGKSKFDFATSNKFLGELSNTENVVINNSFKIICGQLIDHSNVGLFDILGEAPQVTPRSTEAPGKKLTVDRVTELARIKAEELKIATANQLKAGINENLKSKLQKEIASIQFGNVLFRGERPNAFNIVTGQQQITDLNPISGRLGNFTKETIQEIDKKSSVDIKPNEQERANRIKTILSHNVKDFGENPTQAVINGIIITNLGNVLSQ